jgi:hypothetical protein
MASRIIDRYLDELAGRLPAGAWRRRALAEIEDHLRCSAVDLGHLGDEGAQREAAARLGSVDVVARSLAGDHAFDVVRGSAAVHALLLLALLGASLTTWNGPWLTGDSGDSPVGAIATFLLVQVAWTTSSLAWLRAWRTRSRPTPNAGELVVLLRGLAVGLATYGAALLVRIAEKLTGAAGHTTWTGLLVLLGLAAAGAAAVAWTAWRLRSTRRLLGDGRAEPAGLVGGAGRRWWWLVALVSAAAAVCAYQVGSMPDGLWPALAAAGSWRAAAAGVVCAAAEAAAVAGCAGLLGRPLALR